MSSTLVDRFRLRAGDSTSRARLTWLADSDESCESTSYGELDRRARALATVLLDRGGRGERVLVLAPPGLDYMAAIIGGFYAGVTIVPAFPPEPGRMGRAIARLRAIAKDSRARFVIAPSTLRHALAKEPWANEWGPSWIDLDDVSDDAADAWREWRPPADGLALLQYTSGSTSEPRGVMVSHANLATNTSLFARPEYFALTSESVVVSWVPLFHDLGLVSMFLGAVSAGCSFVHFSAARFALDPMRWLRAISRHAGTHTAAPNFAYELCVRKSTEEDLAGLDLSTLRVAMNGAEPARVETMQRFAQRFARCGLDPRALVHHYGMAEHTAFVSGTGRGGELGGVDFDRAALARGQAVPASLPSARTTLPSLATPPDEHAIKIVDPATSLPSAPGTVGEIWITGGSVAGGYFERPDETAVAFRARVEGDPRPYLRTGDLGFIFGSELFITGRLKDLIIVRGVNHYPQDIERIVERADARVRAGSVAAFEVDSDDEEARGVGIVAEVTQSGLSHDEAARVIEGIRGKVATEEGVHLTSVVLVRSGTSLKTTSGKIRRRATREALSNGELTVEAAWHEASERPSTRLPAESASMWSYETVWQPADVPRRGLQSGSWMVVGGPGGLAAALERALSDAGVNVVMVSNDASWDALGGDALVRAIEQALPELSARGDVRGLIVLSALERRDGGSSVALCHAVRSASELAAQRGLGKVVVVTRGAQRHGGGAVSCSQAALLGLARAISFDQPPHPCVLVDLDPSTSSDAAEAASIAASVLADSEEPELLLRAGQRFVPRLHLVQSRTHARGSELTAGTLSSGIHVVGAFDVALGISIADALTERGARRLVMLGDPSNGALSRFARAKRDDGVTVEIVTAEALADSAWLSDIRGVALTLADGAKQMGGFAIALAKLHALDVAFGTHPGLDYFVTCSHALGTLGAPSAQEEAALATALDAIAQRRLASGLVATALGLGPVAEDEEHAAQLTSAGIRFARHADVFSAILAVAAEGARGARLVLPFDLAALLDLLPLASDRPIFHVLTRPEAHARRDRDVDAITPFKAPRNEVELVLTQLVASTLRVDRVSVDDSFFSLGGDSILATDLLAKVNARFGVAMGPSQLDRLFERFTVEAMASVLQQAIRGETRLAPSTAAPSNRATEPEPLSPAQIELWMGDQLVQGTPANNLACWASIRRPVDRTRLQGALDALVRRHEALRATIVEIEGEPKWKLHDALPLEISFFDLRAYPVEERFASARETGAARIRRPFDAPSSRLIDVALFQLDDARFELLLVGHHAVLDGMSIGLFFRELITLEAGLEASDVEQGVSYIDLLAVERRARHEEAEAGNSLRFWRELLSKGVEPVTLPYDDTSARPPIGPGARATKRLSPELRRSIRDLQRAEGVSWVSIVLVTISAVLSRMSPTERPCMGVFVGGRGHPSSRQQIGSFSHILPLPVDFTERRDFASSIREVHRNLGRATTHDGITSTEIARVLELPRSDGLNPLFRVVVSVQSPMPSLEAHGVEFQDLAYEDTGAAVHDLLVSVFDRADDLAMVVDYRSDAYRAETVESFLEALEVFLESAVVLPSSPVAELPLVRDADWARALGRLAGPTDPRPLESVIAQFEGVVARHPDRPAVSCRGRTVGYAELDVRASELAEQLTKRGVTRGDSILLVLEKDIAWVVAILATLKIGAVFIPTGPTWPHEQIQFVIGETRPVIGLADVVGLERLRGVELPALQLSSEPSAGPNSPRASKPAVALGAGDPAYIMYTSGSTGRPKGVRLEHAGLSNVTRALRERPGVNDRDVVLCVANMAFDASLGDMFTALTSGARLAIAPDDVVFDESRLAGLIADEGATVMNATPSLWRLLLAGEWQGKSDLAAWAGGEALPTDLARQLSERCAEVWNVYGPTETSIWTTVSRIDPVRERVTLGAPVANCILAVLDKERRPLPLGSIGELWIGGVPVGLGYHNRPELTAESFRVLDLPTGPSRSYRTGDLVRWRTDGELEFVGRSDKQVKLRGHRIELGQVEANVRELAGVVDAAALVRDFGPWDARLVLYFVADPSRLLDADAIRDHLQSVLPTYMVPSSFVRLEQLPRTANNKLDLRQLPMPEIVASITSNDPSLAPMEVRVLEHWRAVLRRDVIDPDRQFFEQGGHSFSMVALRQRLERDLGRPVPTSILYRYTTVRALAAYLSRDARREEPAEAMSSYRDAAARKGARLAALRARRS